MPDACLVCKLKIDLSAEIPCLSPFCPKALDVDEVEVSEDKLNELFGLGPSAVVVPHTVEVEESRGNDFWATSDIAPL